MSGTITPPGIIVSNPINRQTIPFGDRPFVDRNGNLTPAAYQFLQRLQQGFGATVANVGTIISTVNTIDVDLGSIEAEIGTLFADIAQLETEISGILPAPPPADVLPPFPDLIPAPVLGPVDSLPPPPFIIPLNGGSVLLESGSASEKISQLPTTASTLSGLESFVVASSGSNIRVNGTQLAVMILSDTFSGGQYPLDAPSGSGNSGLTLALFGGAGDTFGQAGSVDIQAGLVPAASGNNGGDVDIFSTGGDGFGSGGNLNFNAGPGGLTGGNGGVVTLRSGNGGGTGFGGDVDVAAGPGGTGAGAGGGNVDVTAGPAAGGSGGPGGNVTLQPGPGDGSGANGNLILLSLPTSAPAVSGAVWIDTSVTPHTLRIAP